MVKYWLTYTGINGDVYNLDIIDALYTGEPIEIRGTAIHSYNDRKDNLTPVTASFLSIELEADLGLTLQDLYTEEESKYKVRFSRNNSVIFYGILKPDGIWEDYVSDRWYISMDAMDGLSILKELSFVKDDGSFFVGKVTQFEALKQCLKRIGYDLPINVTTDLPIYDGFSGNDTVLKSVKVNADRFYQDAEKNNIMDCEAVLNSILEIYSANIFQMNGEWWIIRPLDLKPEMSFYRYDGETKTDIVWNAALNIGSNIDGYIIHHANANQKKSITPSTQAFRVNYKYGNVKNTLQNPRLEVTPDLISEGWIINQFDNLVSAQPDGEGILWWGQDQTQDLWILELDQSVVLAKLEAVTLRLNVRVESENEMLNIAISVYLATENFVYDYDRWIPKVNTSPINSRVISTYGSSEMVLEYPFEQIPETSPIYLQINVSSDADSSTPIPYKVFFDSVEIVPNESSKSTFKGEFHTAQRKTRVSSVTKEDKTVNNGDSLSDIYYGTLYDAEGAPTNHWNGSGKQLLQLMVEDALRIAPRPMFLFEGDVFGYYPYLSFVAINNVPGKFQISKYSYNTAENINSANFSEFENLPLIEGTDYTYEFEYDYGAETKVTIRS